MGVALPLPDPVIFYTCYIWVGNPCGTAKQRYIFQPEIVIYAGFIGYI